MSDFTEGAGGERVHHVHRSYVDDDRLGAIFNHLLNQAQPQLIKVRVGEGGLKGGDEERTLLENRDFHVALPPLCLAWLR